GVGELRAGVAELPTLRFAERYRLLFTLHISDDLPKYKLFGSAWLRRLSKRSITDKEISLIKAMLSRGMKNKDIQFFFNKPDRSVNSGRITGIRSGSYSNSRDIQTATSEELEFFISENGYSTPASISVPLVGDVNRMSSPTDHSKLIQLFVEAPAGKLRFVPEETDEHECKYSFSLRASDKWLKPIAGLANNRGGFVAFGIRDPKDPKATETYFEGAGLERDDFETTDVADILTRVKSSLDPTPRFECCSCRIDGRFFGFIYVYESKSKPVIATKNEGAIKEGDIYFRYPGQTSRIKYSDLRSIMDERDVDARSKMVPMFSELARLGPENATLADLTTGQVYDPSRSISIDQALLKQLQKIKSNNDPDAPSVVIAGELVQPSANSEVEYRTRNILEEYPLSATEVWREVKNLLPNAKQGDAWTVLKKLKGRKEFCAYNFRNQKQERLALASGRVPTSTPVIYNNAAVLEVITLLGGQTNPATP
uniref:AlbA family DNA-binding domain-containing protein n=1 Tax=Litoreibacter halocynthiae TaxID=1242689 RepID=UPI0024937AEF